VWPSYRQKPVRSFVLSGAPINQLLKAVTGVPVASRLWARLLASGAFIKLRGEPLIPTTWLESTGMTGGSVVGSVTTPTVLSLPQLLQHTQDLGALNQLYDISAMNAAP
jgi:hypothetical protein